MSTYPPIILAAHGSREPQALETFDRFDQAVRNHFPGHTVLWTFADYILRGLRQQQSSPLLDRIYLPGEPQIRELTHAVVQPLFVAPAPLNLSDLHAGFRIGHALLDRPEHILEVAAIIEPRLVDDETAYILCGHGSKKHPECNQPLIDLHAKLHARHDNVFLSTLDGPPGHENLATIKTDGFARAHFIPLMFSSGKHICYDVMGDGPESWKSRVGLPAVTDAPFGDHPQIIQLFISRIQSLLS